MTERRDGKEEGDRERVGDKLGETQRNEKKRELNTAEEIGKKRHRHTQGRRKKEATGA